MALSGEKGAPHPEDINDDLARETHFYEQALATANAAIRKLKDLGVATRRPDDFYAEMVKSDEHMKRVRAELIFEQTSLETREERRKAREQKRYGKQVQAEKLKERTLQKKESIKSLDKWRKQRKRSGFADDGKAPEGFEDDAPKKRNARESRGGGGQHGGASQKREFKDDKFGFGGRKRVRPQSPLFFSSSIRRIFSRLAWPGKSVLFVLRNPHRPKAGAGRAARMPRHLAHWGTFSSTVHIPSSNA